VQIVSIFPFSSSREHRLPRLLEDEHSLGRRPQNGTILNGVFPVNFPLFSTKTEILLLAREVLALRFAAGKKSCSGRQSFRQNRNMNLNDEQREKVAEWIAQGLKLSEIQNRLGSELGVVMTYMDVRLLVDDLKLTPKDVEPPRPRLPAQAVGASPSTPAPTPSSPLSPQAPGAASVSVRVDQIARPGTLVSGKVTFTDGVTADWHLDQTGRLGLAPQQAGYRPGAADLQQFQAALDGELSKLGF
jgi:hypothetical protein